MSKHFDVRAYRAAQEPPGVTLSTGERLTGRPLSFNKALEWQEKIEAEMASGGAGKIVLQDALTDFGFDAEKILNDLSPEEVGEALRDFFGYPKKSSENPEPTTTQS